jgi:hypothetical protein
MTTNPMQLLSVQGQAGPYLAQRRIRIPRKEIIAGAYTAHNFGSCNRQQDEI